MQTHRRKTLQKKGVVPARVKRTIRLHTAEISFANKNEDNGLFKKVERFILCTQAFTLVAGIIAAGIGFLLTTREARVEKTIGMRKEFVSDVKSTYLDLVDRWDQFTATNSDWDSAEPAKRNMAIQVFFSNNKDIRQGYDKVEDFFQSLWICVESRSCDQNTALLTFDEYVTTIFEISKPYIDEVRRRDHNIGFGAGIEAMYSIKNEGWMHSIRPW